jgi:Glyoxalase-like domain
VTALARIALAVRGDGPVSFDHAVIAVSDLPAAMTELQETGFEVVYGGRHVEHGTHNAVVLLDGGYLELIALEAPTSTPGSRLAADVAAVADAGGGLLGYAIAIDDGPEAQRLVAAARVDGQFPKPLVMDRLGDGNRLRWELRFAERDGFLGPYPFFIRWTSPSPYERHDRERHRNGVTAVSAIEVVIESGSARAVSWYRDVLGPAMGSFVEMTAAPDQPRPAHGGRLTAITLTGLSHRACELALDPRLFGDTILRLE